MSATPTRPAPPAIAGVVPVAGLALAGFALLLLRPWAAGASPGWITFAGIYLLLGALSLSVSLPVGLPAAGFAPVVTVGLGAVLLAHVLAGPSIPLPAGPGALALSAMAAVSEEAFFRRFLYGALARFGAGLAVAVSALLFALVHVPAYGLAVFWVDLGAGLVFSWQRWASGGWAAPATTHLAANLLAAL